MSQASLGEYTASSMKSTDKGLFESSPAHDQPLAARMRPRTIDEYVGQDHILGPGRLLRRAIAADQLTSIILSGPPGTGKTTLARVIANSTTSGFLSINAVLAGVAEIREAIAQAREQKDLYGRRTILFVDEVHRWNKAQQDALLPWVENGTFVLVGATTENPWFEVNAALVSRSRIFQLTALSEDDLEKIAAQALADKGRGYGQYRVSIEHDALKHLVRTASGDARSLLNAIELAVETNPDGFPPKNDQAIVVDLASAEESIQRKAVLYDKDGDYHFDSISAFIKSVRGSDPDAALYWLARMVNGGESPRFILRRLMILASEDVGLAQPQALAQVESAAAAFDRVGLPEGQYFLSQATLYLCLCPKSNSTMGYFDALKSLEKETAHQVPLSLKDGNRDGDGLGHGKGYRYPHAYQEHWVAQEYLPHYLRGRVFYQSGPLGWEGERQTELARRREVQLALAASNEELQDEQLRSAGPKDASLDYFLRRSNADMESWILQVRDAVFQKLALQGHERLVVCGEDLEIVASEGLRTVSSGFLYLVASEAKLERADNILGQARLASQVLKDQAPSWQSCPVESELSFNNGKPERIAGWRTLTSHNENGLVARLATVCDSSCQMVLAEPLNAAGTSLVSLLSRSSMRELELEQLVRAEQDFRASQASVQNLSDQLAKSGWKLVWHEQMTLQRKRRMVPAQLEAWLSTSRLNSYGNFMVQTLGTELFERFGKALHESVSGATCDWETVIVVLDCRLV